MSDLTEITGTCNFVFLGQSGVGKTSIIIRYSKNVFNQNGSPTIGCAFQNTIEQFQELNQKIKCDIWDTAGQERYAALAPQYTRKANIVMITFDITDKQTFERAKVWIQDVLKQQSSQHLTQRMVLVANKCDEENDKWQVTEKEVNEYIAQQLSDLAMQFFVVSAKSGFGIIDMFKKLVREYAQTLKKTEQSLEKQDQKIKNVENKSKNAGKCC